MLCAIETEKHTQRLLLAGIFYYMGIQTAVCLLGTDTPTHFYCRAYLLVGKKHTI